ncbi:glycosyltransferase family 2 protein [Candidatus Beckwithbacteria bacterium]|nr:glycosyltransferase family 2 protein [Candidatus Beckwithbacteria bacterium]
MKLSVIVPVYNEEKTIEEIIKRILKARKNLEIIVVDDASSDKTPKILKKIKSKQITVLLHQKNQGKGAAIRTALAKVSGDIVIIQDADLEYDPSEYERLINPIIKGKAEVVYGSRFTGEHRNLLFWNFVANHLLNLLANILYNTTLSDLETCYKAFKSEVIKSIRWKANRFDFEPEITARILKKHIYIYEMPISYVGRDYTQGKKIGFWDGVTAFWVLIKLRLMD